MNVSSGFELRGVSKSYGANVVLMEVSLSFPPGEPIALLGASGSGKSTVLRILAGLEMPDQGQVLVDGRVATNGALLLIPPFDRRLSMVFQDLALWSNLTALGNVLLGLTRVCRSRREARHRAIETLRRCGIENLRDRKPVTLSGGQQQRVAIARALAPRPRFLFLDEPFAGLDVLAKAHLLGDLKALTAEGETTIVLVTHDLLEVVGLCDTAAVMDKGRVAAQGRVTEIVETCRLPLFEQFRAKMLGVVQSGSNRAKDAPEVRL